jgi:hypothetical protein
MAFNANFTEVRLDGDGTLLVKGTSLPANGAREIMVSLAHGRHLLSSVAEDPQQNPWTARFAPDKPKFRVGTDVFLAGMALRTGDHDPLVWQGGFTIQSLDDR